MAATAPVMAVFFSVLLLLVLHRPAAGRVIAGMVFDTDEHDRLSLCENEFQELKRHRLNATAAGVHLPLHHPRGPCSPAKHLRALPLSTVLLHDDARVASFAARLADARPASSSSRPTALLDRAAGALTESAVSAPLNPGDSVGVGNYITRIGFGTPSTSSVVVVDTGSSLSWIQCQPCVVSCHAEVGSIFNPSSSPTYRQVSCSAQQCDELQTATLNPSACSNANGCIYQASYGDGSYSLGYLSEDAVSVGSASFPGFVFGCGQDNEGLFGGSDGLVGLAKNSLSLFYQLAPRVGYEFAYCLPSSSSTGFLSIGSGTPGSFSFTPLVSNSVDGSLYFVSIEQITVAGTPLSVTPSAYSSLPTILDSGTVITRLPDAVYTALRKAVSAALIRYPKASAYSILDTCFKGSVSGISVPPVSIVYAGGAVTRLPPENVLLDVDGSTTCLAFSASSNVAIIGNTQQQTFTVLYDAAQSKVGFAAGGCR